MSLLWKTAILAAAHPLTQQDWYHGGDLQGGKSLHDKSSHSNSGWLHIGTQQAALDRIDPDNWDAEDRSISGGTTGWVPHARLHRVRLAAGTTVCPLMHKDHEEMGSDDYTCPHKADAHQYQNDAEDSGSVSLAVKPSKVRVEEDLGRHPKWTDPEVRQRWSDGRAQ